MELCLPAAKRTVSALRTGMSEKSGDTYTHTHTPVALEGGLWQRVGGDAGDIPNWDIAVCTRVE